MTAAGNVSFTDTTAAAGPARGPGVGHSAGSAGGPRGSQAPRGEWTPLPVAPLRTVSVTGPEPGPRR